MKYSTLLLAFTLILAAPELRADEQTRRAQSSLKDEGSYFGQLDGTAGPEYSAALKRYQIRNGLEVTGQSNEETMKALGLEGSRSPEKSPAPLSVNRSAPAAPASPKERPRVDLRREESVVQSDRRALAEPERPSRDEAPRGERPERSYVPPSRDRSIVPPPASYDRGPVPQGDYRYRELYEATPYASAPRPLQEQTLRAAQKTLAAQGFYDGVLDGQPGPDTTDAVFQYQRARRLPPTGRLDLETLSALRLLPGARSENPGLRPFTDPRRSPERSTYRGVWVR